MFFDHTYADALARGLVLATIGLAWVIVLIRIVGLRALSKMTNFDFVMTVAMGSLLAGAAQASAWPAFVQTATAMAALFAIQFVLAWMRQRSDPVARTLQNAPVLLMKDGVMLHDALRQTRVTEDDLIAKLREANALEMSAVRAVILEATGDISVLHGPQLDRTLLTGLPQDSGP